MDCGQIFERTKELGLQRLRFHAVLLHALLRWCHTPTSILWTKRASADEEGPFRRATSDTLHYCNIEGCYCCRGRR